MTRAHSVTRFLIFMMIGSLVGFLVVASIAVIPRLRDISTASSDNIQWTISQAETELARLSATLADADADPAFDPAQVQLRANLALSRLSLLQSGRVREVLSESRLAVAYLGQADAYFEEASALLDQPGPLSPADIGHFRAMTNDIRGVIRQLAVEGVLLSSDRAEAMRQDVLSQLRLTAGAAAALILVLSLVLVMLDHLLRKARQTDEDLRSSSALLWSTVAASLDAIVVADEQGIVRDFNASAERILGWSRDEIVGRSLGDTIIPAAFRDAHSAGMRHYLDTGEKRVVDQGRVELSALRKSGEEFPVELNITSAALGGQTTFIAYLRDISARKANEASLIAARDRAERADRAKSRFLAMMSHEMRTPLNGILGVLDLMRSSDLTDRQGRYVKAATSAGEILLQHINEAIDITRIETGEISLSSTPFNLAEQVSSVVDGLHPLAVEKGLELSFEIAPTLNCMVLGDSFRFRQILTNLLGNAIKFTDQGQVSVRMDGTAGAEEVAIALAVADTGPGIAQADLDRVFDDFVTLEHRSNDRQSRGDGLGLAISRRIAWLMRGDLTVSSELGQGSEFTLHLTLARGRRNAPSGLAETPPDTRAATAARTVLVVDDNPINRSIIRDMLEDLGHSVLEAEDGFAAIRAAQQQDVDVIFMDISMPGMDGIETTRRIRGDGGRHLLTPIVGVTAHDPEAYDSAAQEAGMTRLLSKPLRLRDLYRVLDDLFAPSGGGAAADGINADTLAELVKAIGPDKVGKAIRRFLADMAEMFTTIGQQGDTACRAQDRKDLLHKLTGAALMLGLDSVPARLAPLVDTAPTPDQLEAVRAEIQKTCQAALARLG